LQLDQIATSGRAWVAVCFQHVQHVDEQAEGEPVIGGGTGQRVHPWQRVDATLVGDAADAGGHDVAARA
jgi:hypothetical protein